MNKSIDNRTIYKKILPPIKTTARVFIINLLLRFDYADVILHICITNRK